MDCLTQKLSAPDSTFVNELETFGQTFIQSVPHRLHEEVVIFQTFLIFRDH